MGERCARFQIAPDSSRVLYQATATSQVSELCGSVSPVVPRQRHLQRR